MHFKKNNKFKRKYFHLSFFIHKEEITDKKVKECVNIMLPCQTLHLRFRNDTYNNCRHALLCLIEIYHFDDVKWHRRVPDYDIEFSTFLSN